MNKEFVKLAIKRVDDYLDKAKDNINTALRFFNEIKVELKKDEDKENEKM